MREIKFRAWDADNKKMIYDGDRYYPKYFDRELKGVTGKCIVTHRGIYFWVHESQSPNATEKHFDHCSIRLPNEMKIMQYTGLKDKKGVEIYEGDIVNVFDWGVKTKNDIIGVSFFEWDLDINGWIHNPCFEIDCYDMWRNVEVIGNLHEDKELLNGS